MNTRTFTLVELLVVVAVISILAGMLLPALQKARTSAVTVNCLAQVRDVATTLAMYADDQDGYIPPFNQKTVADGGNSGNKLWWANILVDNQYFQKPQWNDQNWGKVKSGISRCPGLAIATTGYGGIGPASRIAKYGGSGKPAKIAKPSAVIMTGDTASVYSASGGGDAAELNLYPTNPPNYVYNGGRVLERHGGYNGFVNAGYVDGHAASARDVLLRLDASTRENSFAPSDFLP